MNGAERIAAERKRQIEEEGWDAKHDDRTCVNGELPMLAVCYLIRKINIGKYNETLLPYDWWQWLKLTPDNRIRELEKAGALIAAEIDRLLRIEAQNG